MTMNVIQSRGNLIPWIISIKMEQPLRNRVSHYFLN